MRLNLLLFFLISFVKSFPTLDYLEPKSFTPFFCTEPDLFELNETYIFFGDRDSIYLGTINGFYKFGIPYFEGKPYDPIDIEELNEINRQKQKKRKDGKQVEPEEPVEPIEDNEKFILNLRQAFYMDHRIENDERNPKSDDELVYDMLFEEDLFAFANYKGDAYAFWPYSYCYQLKLPTTFRKDCKKILAGDNDLSSDDFFNFIFSSKSDFTIHLSWKTNTTLNVKYYYHDVDKHGKLQIVDQKMTWPNDNFYKAFVADGTGDYKYLYELDRNLVLHIQRFHVEVIKDEEVFNLRLFKDQYDINITRILCSHDIEKFYDLKGIFYLNGTTYLIFYQYYLMYDQDLIEERFDLNIDSPEKMQIVFKNETEDVRYNLSVHYKWSMVYGYEKIYSKFIDDPIYKVNVENGNLTFEKVEEVLNVHCSGQILMLDEENMFCFEGSTYFKNFFTEKIDNEFKDKRMNVFTIFKDIQMEPRIDFNSTPIEFIFTYKDNEVIFMTKTHIIHLDLELFSVKNDMIILSQPNDYQIFIDEICLLRDCAPKKYRPRPNESGSESGSGFGYIMIFLFIILSLALTAFFLSPKSLPIRKEIMIKFNKYRDMAKEKWPIIVKYIQSKKRGKQKPSSIDASRKIDGGGDSKLFSFFTLMKNFRKGKPVKNWKPPKRNKPLKQLASTQTFPFFVSKSRERIMKAKKDVVQSKF